MLEDIASIAQDSTVEADVCVVGAGAAGLTVARALTERASLSVCLLEAGGFDFEAAVNDLGAGSNVGMPYYDLVDSRLRFFGGTTNIWGGRCAPMDAEDFAVREWVPHSGWPIGPEDLEEGYRRAHADMQIGAPVTLEDAWQRVGSRMPSYLTDDFTTSFWYFDELAERFNASRCRDLIEAPNLRIITHAGVTHLQATAHANGLSHLEFGALGGKRGRVVARAYVLATGAIENARLLLASNDVESAGIGNRHDQVGRYFMEHPHGRLGRVNADTALDLWLAFAKRFPRGSVPLAPVLRPSAEVQAREGILNTALTFKVQRNPDQGLALHRQAYQSLKHELSPTATNRALWHQYNRLRRVAQRYRRRLIRPMTAIRRQGVYAMIRAEQAPNPESRVLLGSERDALGQPRANLNWALSAQDKHTLRVLADLLHGRLSQAGVGSFERAEWIDDPDPSWPVDSTVGNHPIGGYHHMGTTRMSSTPANGVTDRDCQVFGYENLYVAGSSLFSTAGWANPTLTIVALAHRLAGHLRDEVLRD
jgi:choline dehydrogenase-like flavoprotein